MAVNPLRVVLPVTFNVDAVTPLKIVFPLTCKSPSISNKSKSISIELPVIDNIEVDVPDGMVELVILIVTGPSKVVSPETLKSPLTVRPDMVLIVASNVEPELSKIVKVFGEYVKPVIYVSGSTGRF